MFGMDPCLELCSGVIVCCMTLNLNHAFNNLSRIGQCTSVVCLTELTKPIFDEKIKVTNVPYDVDKGGVL